MLLCRLCVSALICSSSVGQLKFRSQKITPNETFASAKSIPKLKSYNDSQPCPEVAYRCLVNMCSVRMNTQVTLHKGKWDAPRHGRRHGADTGGAERAARCRDNSMRRGTLTQPTSRGRRRVSWRSPRNRWGRRDSHVGHAPGVSSCRAGAAARTKRRARSGAPSWCWGWWRAQNGEQCLPGEQPVL